MGVKIVIDSTVDVNEDIKDKMTVVPLTIRFGDREFVDGVTMTHSEFYEKLIETDILPTTSQAAPDDFLRVLTPIVNDGDEAVVITLSSRLSGTCQSANIAAEEFDGKVYVVDSKSVSVGAGILAELACKLVEDGRNSAKEIAQKLKSEVDNIQIVALLDTLEYLKKGGRISKAVAFAGGLLAIKPVVSMQDGEVKMLGKARGSKQGNNLLVEEIGKAGGIDFSKPVLLGYTGLTDVLLVKYIEDSKDLWSVGIVKPNITNIGSVVGTHAGPGAIAAAFFANKNDMC